AIPYEDVLAALPRLKQGKDLRRGMLGVTPKSRDAYGEPPAVGTVAPDSAAAKAGLQAGDVILEIDGRPVANQTQLLTALGPRYEGDTVSVKVRRGKEDIVFKDVTLQGTVLS